MKCIICNGDKVIERNGQVEICDNCEGRGEIVTESKVYGNDCKSGECV